MDVSSVYNDIIRREIVGVVHMRTDIKFLTLAQKGPKVKISTQK